MFIDTILYEVTKIKKYSEGSPKVFAALCGVSGPLIWKYLQSVWFVYFMGKLSVYGIAASNLSFKQETVISQLFFAIALSLLYVFSNMVCFEVLKPERTTDCTGKWTILKKLKRFGKWAVRNVLFFAAETVVSLCMLIYAEGYQVTFNQYVFTDKSFYRALWAMLCVVFAFNAFGISGVVVALLGKLRHQDNIDEEELSTKKLVETIIIGMLVMAAVLGYAFVVGRNMEQTRKSSRAIVEITGEINSDYGNIPGIPEGMRVSPIVYENDDYYYISNYVVEGNHVYIEKGYYMMIAKEGKNVYILENNDLLIEESKRWKAR